MAANAIYKRLTRELQKDKPRKYRNQPVEVDGIKFASKREAARYGENLLRQKDGEIRNLVPHPKFDLIVNGVRIGTYKADSGYEEKQFTGHPYYDDEWYAVVEDVKSPATAKAKEFRRTLKLMKAIHGIDIRVIL